ncbi:hypothetical protein DNTS_029966 [Danionella cerebrum]|uniref:Uncharacterized protein n=1 Tax=Danionella cerebrum TaxID=2873325 RepID=A0A553PXS8_9TELE|nr:hypothetical protein DNTS_029966 [Danionella translucida]
MRGRSSTGREKAVVARSWSEGDDQCGVAFESWDDSNCCALPRLESLELTLLHVSPSQLRHVRTCPVRGSEKPRFVTASKVILMTRGLQRIVARFQRNPSRFDPIKKLVDFLMLEMMKRFGRVEHNEKLADATCLDPRFKKQGFVSQQAAEDTVKRVTAAAAAINPSLNGDGELSANHEKGRAYKTLPAQHTAPLSSEVFSGQCVLRLVNPARSLIRSVSLDSLTLWETFDFDWETFETFDFDWDSDVDVDPSAVDVGLLTVLPEEMPAQTPHVLNHCVSQTGAFSSSDVFSFVLENHNNNGGEANTSRGQSMPPKGPNNSPRLLPRHSGTFGVIVALKMTLQHSLEKMGSSCQFNRQ